MIGPIEMTRHPDPNEEQEIEVVGRVGYQPDRENDPEQAPPLHEEPRIAGGKH